MTAHWQSLGWAPASILVMLGFLAFVVTVVRHENARKRRAHTLSRLNSPFFRQITDAHYRAGNLN
jgi:hypothetical protein